MTANVTFFEHSPFFPTSTQDSKSIQNVLPIHLIESSTPVIQNIIHDPTEPVPPPIITYQHRNQMASPIPQGESSSEGPSLSSPDTTTPIHDDLSCLCMKLSVIPLQSLSIFLPIFSHFYTSHSLPINNFVIVLFDSIVTQFLNLRFGIV